MAGGADGIRNIHTHISRYLRLEGKVRRSTGWCHSDRRWRMETAVTRDYWRAAAANPREEWPDVTWSVRGESSWPLNPAEWSRRYAGILNSDAISATWYCLSEDEPRRRQRCYYRDEEASSFAFVSRLEPCRRAAVA